MSNDEESIDAPELVWAAVWPWACFRTKYPALNFVAAVIYKDSVSVFHSEHSKRQHAFVKKGEQYNELWRLGEPPSEATFQPVPWPVFEAFAKAKETRIKVIQPIVLCCFCSVFVDSKTAHDHWQVRYFPTAMSTNPWTATAKKRTPESIKREIEQVESITHEYPPFVFGVCGWCKKEPFRRKFRRHALPIETYRHTLDIQSRIWRQLEWRFGFYSRKASRVRDRIRWSEAFEQPGRFSEMAKKWDLEDIKDLRKKHVGRKIPRKENIFSLINATTTLTKIGNEITSDY